MTITAAMTTLQLIGEVSFEAPRIQAMEDGASEPAPTESKDKGRWLNIDAYQGGPINVGWGYPCVIDLSSLELKRGRFPAFFKHDPDKIVGFIGETMNDGRSMKVKAKCVKTEWAQHVCALADEGYPWQASIGVDPIRAAFIDEGQKIMVNGREIEGPFFHIHGKLRETSIVPLGADSDTDVIAARAQKPEAPAKEFQVNLEEVKKIQAEFADDPAFAMQCVGEGKTLIEAKAAYADVLRQREKDRIAAEANKPKPPATVPPVQSSAQSQGALEGGSPRQLFESRVAQLIQAGRSRAQAVASVARENPTLHRQFLAEANPNKALPTAYA